MTILISLYLVKLSSKIFDMYILQKSKSLLKRIKQAKKRICKK